MEYIQLIITVIIILLVFGFSEYLRKKQAEDTKKMQADIKVNDKIVTYTGLSGTVKEVLEDRVIINANPSEVELSIEKWAIAGTDDRNIQYVRK